LSGMVVTGRTRFEGGFGIGETQPATAVRREMSAANS
jgi:hypothetical protein